MSQYYIFIFKTHTVTQPYIMSILRRDKKSIYLYSLICEREYDDS